MSLSRCLPALVLVGFFVACSSDNVVVDNGSAGASGSSAHAGSGTGGAPVLGAAGATTTAGSNAGGATAAAGSSAAGAPAGGSIGIAGSPAAAGATAMAGATGTGVGLPPFGPPPEDKPATYEVGVRNNCPFPIWLHGAGNGGTLMPDNKQLMKGEHIWYDAPKQWSAARITAFGDGPQQGELDKVEMTLNDSLNYNVTYVDWVALPVEVIGVGTGGDCKKAACYVPEAQVLTGCPDGLLSGKRCNAARSFCLNGANKNAPYCHKLDAAIASCVATIPDCAKAAGATTSDVYACAGPLGNNPKWCAALNRNMVDAPDSTDLKKFYQKDPYNTYSKWVHDVCPGIYAFAYDDYPANAGESGFHSCTGPKYMEITFCPAG